MLYSCTHTATVGVKRLIKDLRRHDTDKLQNDPRVDASIVNCSSTKSHLPRLDPEPWPSSVPCWQTSLLRHRSRGHISRSYPIGRCCRPTTLTLALPEFIVGVSSDGGVASTCCQHGVANNVRVVEFGATNCTVFIAPPHAERDLVIAVSSLCTSVTLWYCVKTARQVVQIFSPPARPITPELKVLFEIPTSTPPHTHTH